VSLAELQENPQIQTYLDKANECACLLGCIEHGARHAKVCADTGRALMAKLGYGGIDMELSAIAGFLHDIGWLVNKDHHRMVSAHLAHQFMSMKEGQPENVATVMSAIGNHGGLHPQPVGTVSAAVILSDFADIHQSRLRKENPVDFDDKDKLHAATQSSSLVVDQRQRTITLELDVDESRFPVNAYFQAFLPRVGAMRTAASTLNSSFRLVVNKSRLL